MKVFFPFEFDEDIKKMTNTGTYSRNVYTCVEHIRKFKIFKEFKNILIKIQSGNVQIEFGSTKQGQGLMLNELESLIRYDVDMKKLFLISQQFDIISIIISLLGTFGINIDLLILKIFSCLSKEREFQKYESLEEISVKLFRYFLSLDFNPYKFNKGDEGTITNFEYSIFIVLLNIFSNIFSNKPELIDSEIKVNLLNSLFNISVNILNSNEVETKIKANMKSKADEIPTLVVEFIKKNQLNLFNSIILSTNVIYNYSKLDPELKNSIKLFLISNFNNIVEHSLKEMENLTSFISFNKTLIIMLNNILNSIYNTKLEELPEGTEAFNTKIKEYLFSLEQNNFTVVYNFSIVYTKVKELNNLISDKFSFSQSKLK